MIWPSVKQCFPPTDCPIRDHGYSAAVRSDDLLFVSGQVGSRADGSPEPDFEAQVRRAFANLEATLRRRMQIRRHCRCDDVPYGSGEANGHHHGGEEREVSASSLPELDRHRVNWLAGFDFEIKVIARVPSLHQRR